MAIRWKKEDLLPRLAALDGDRLRSLLCELYRAGPDKVRERIEGAVEPERRRANAGEDVRAVLHEIDEFIALANAGEFFNGRAVSPGRKTKWRHEFRAAFQNATRLLATPVRDDAAGALEQLVDLAHRAGQIELFRSEDPVEAAKVVVSDAVAALWTVIADREGVEGLVARALPQFARWESPFGWTRGFGEVAAKERPLADIVAGLVGPRAAWERLAEAWLAHLDALLPPAAVTDPVARGRKPRGPSQWEIEEQQRHTERQRGKHAVQFQLWHELLLERLGAEEPTVAKILAHAAIDAPHTWLLRARVAVSAGRRDEAQTLVARGLAKLPGFDPLILVALEEGLELSPRSREIARERRLAERLKGEKRTATPSA